MEQLPNRSPESRATASLSSFARITGSRPGLTDTIDRAGGYLVFTLLPLAVLIFIGYQLLSHLNNISINIPIKKVGSNYGIQPIGTNFLIPETMAIPAGSFEMGNDEIELDEQPLHRVTIDNFEIGRFEVTNAQWQSYCDAERQPYPNNPGYGGDFFIDNPNNPVVNISWFEAQKYCQWLSKITGRQFRLPTEAEWEYTAQTSNQGRVSSNRTKSEPSTAKVGSYSANQFGVADMLGNVWEWCGDWYNPQSYNTSGEFNPIGPANGKMRVLRGGSWGDPAALCRVSNRISYLPDGHYKFYGMRVAVALPQENRAKR